MACADRHQALADVGAGGESKAQPVARVLVHKPPVGAHQPAPHRLRQFEKVGHLAVTQPIFDASPIGPQLRRHAVEERRFS